MDEVDAIQAKKGGSSQREQWVRLPTYLFYSPSCLNSTGHISNGFGGTPIVEFASSVDALSIGCRTCAW